MGMIKLNCVDGLDYDNVMFRKYLIDHISLELGIKVNYIEGLYYGDELGYRMYVIQYNLNSSLCKYMVNVNSDLHRYINDWVTVHNRDNKLNKLLDNDISPRT